MTQFTEKDAPKMILSPGESSLLAPHSGYMWPRYRAETSNPNNNDNPTSVKRGRHLFERILFSVVATSTIVTESPTQQKAPATLRQHHAEPLNCFHLRKKEISQHQNSIIKLCRDLKKWNEMVLLLRI
jgi:hypothetical protein